MVLRNQAFYEDGEKFVQIKAKKCIVRSFWKSLAILIFLGLILFLISIITGIITIENIYDNDEYQPNLPSDKFPENELKFYRNKKILKKNYEVIFDRKKRQVSNLASKMKKIRQKRSAENYERFNCSELDPTEVSCFDLKSKIHDEEIAFELNALEDNYRRCKRTVNDKSCNSILEKINKIEEDLNAKINEMTKLFKEAASLYDEKNQTTEPESKKKYDDNFNENKTKIQDDDDLVTTTKQYTTESSVANRIDHKSHSKFNKTENLGQANIFLNNFTLYFSTFYYNGKNQSGLPLRKYFGKNQKLIIERKKRHIDTLKSEAVSDQQKNNETIYERFNSSELDPIEISYFDLKSKIRDKRAKLELKPLEDNYRRCKRTVNDHSCDEIFIKMYKLAREINEKIDQFSELKEESQLYYGEKAEVSEDEHTRKKYGDMTSKQIEKFPVYSERNNTTTHKGTDVTTTQKIHTSEISTMKRNTEEAETVKFPIHTEVTTESIKTINDITVKTTATENTTTRNKSLRNDSKENELDIDDPLKKKLNKYDSQTPFPSILVPPQIHEDLPSRPGSARSNLRSDHDLMFETLYKKLLKENSHSPNTEQVVTKKPEIKSNLGEPKDWDPALIILFEAWFKNLVKNTTKLSTTTLKPEKKTAVKADVQHKNDFENSPFLTASGPFISLCEDFVRQNFEKNKPQHHQPAIGSSPDNLSGSFTHAPNHLFTGRAPNFPVTGETMKATAQYVFNPNFGMSGMPFCFYASPENLKLFNQNQQSPFYGHTNLHGMPDFGLDPRSRNVGGMMFAPQNMHGNTQSATSISPYNPSTASGFHPFHAKTNFNQQQQPMFCAYMLNNNHGQVGPQMMVPSTFPGAFQFQMRKSDNDTYDDEVSSERKYPNIPSDTDIIYASYANQKSRVDLKQTNCKSDSISCFSNQQCIPKSKWCDSIVDCRDASDETACSCKSRLSKSRICDGYTDCPMGEDEMGCFGCNKLMFSCYHNFEEYIRNGRSTIAMCYRNINKCDGISDCLNGNDEMDCNLIFSGLGNQLAYQKSSAEGFLHRNHKGRWYPVCEMTKSWAHEACENEIGEMDSDPFIDEIPVNMPGPFIRQGKYSEIHFSDNCNNTMYVKCPQIKCGHSKSLPKPFQKKIRARRSINTAEIEEIIREKRFNDDERVVGGDLCKPMKWPFVVALYRNGKFLCGGVIFSDKWIITAAHCVINFNKYYYEVYAGLLRRSSYSSTIQIVKALHIFSHPKYEKITMKNDLALIHLETPLKFNKWVRPICLPSKGKVSGSDKWKNGPAEGTICTAVGWGATREHGLGSDHLREVKIPILSQCKTKVDREANDICAGEPTGGRDACQGDSGGPLFCRSINDSTEWYLAGIVSHGEGCARPDEPGVYTRVAMYLKWIESYSRIKVLRKPKIMPLNSCPGHKCVWGGEKCIQASRRCDRIIDCLGGEDEIGCEYPHFSDEVGVSKNATNLDYDDGLEITLPLDFDAFTSNDLSFEIDSNEEVGSSFPANQSKQKEEQPEDSIKIKDTESLKGFKRIETTAVPIVAENKNKASTPKELNTESYEVKTDKAVSIQTNDSVPKIFSDNVSTNYNLTESPKSTPVLYTESPKKIGPIDSHTINDTSTGLFREKLNSTEQKIQTTTTAPLKVPKVHNVNFSTTVKPEAKTVKAIIIQANDSAPKIFSDDVSTNYNLTESPKSTPVLYTESPKKIGPIDSHTINDTSTDLFREKLNSTEQKIQTTTTTPLKVAKVHNVNFSTTLKPEAKTVKAVTIQAVTIQANDSVPKIFSDDVSTNYNLTESPKSTPVLYTESPKKIGPIDSHTINDTSTDLFREKLDSTEQKIQTTTTTPLKVAKVHYSNFSTTVKPMEELVTNISAEESSFTVGPLLSNVSAVSIENSTKPSVLAESQDSDNHFSVTPAAKTVYFEKLTTENSEREPSATHTYISTEKDLNILFDERLEPQEASTESSLLTDGKIVADEQNDSNYPSTTVVSEDLFTTSNNFVSTTPSQIKEKSGLDHYMGHPVHHKETDKAENIDSNKPPNTNKNLTSIESTPRKPSQVAADTSILTENPSILEETTQNSKKTTTPEFKITTEFNMILDIQTSTDASNLLESSSKKPENITDFMRSLDKMAANFVDNGTIKPTVKEIPNISNVQRSNETDENQNSLDESDTNMNNSYTPTAMERDISTENPIKEINSSDAVNNETLNTQINTVDSILTTESIPTITLTNLKAAMHTEAPNSSENIETKTETQFEYITIDQNSNVINETQPVAPLKVFVPKEKPKKNSNEKNPRNNNKFICKKIFQSIDISNYCDRIIDCEDGTDEENCTCRDYLKGTLNILVCDGKADCEDLTDEENCGNCTDNEFLCPLSQRCIEISKRCDDNIDCQFKEDEMDCYALTNGKTVFLDGNKRPNLHDSGIFSRNKNGMWHIVCSDELNILMKISTHPPAEEICSILGFKGFKSFNITNVLLNNTALPSIIVDENISIETHRKRKRELIQNVSNDCEAFFVECNPHSNNHEPIQTIKNQPIKDMNDESNSLKPNPSSIITEIKDQLKPIKNMHKNHTGKIIEYHSWSVDVYNNGKLKCHGILLDKYWIAVSETCCKHIRLQEDYAVAVLGGQINRNLHSKGPHQQIQRIDCMQPIIESNIVLLHLEHPVHFTRYVLPTFLPDMEKEPHESRHSYECMVVTHNKNGTVISVKVKEILDQTICKLDNDFKKKNINICLESVDKHIDSLCHDNKINTATLLCRQDNSGWYPKSFFEIPSENCDFREPFIVEEIYKKHDNIQYVIGNHKCELARYSKPICTTHRCPLGKCLNSQQFCDGKMDCHDGSDESPELCHKKECRATDLRCKNGNCVSKSKFCDQKDDCGDLTDEPTTCSCYTYLKASDPGKICDGIRNCWDKSDENPAFCDCGPNRFQCGHTDECVSRDVICDQEYDCPNGEDEQFCYGLEYPSFPYINNDGYGQVIEQSYGTWHTKCFPRNHTLTNTEIGEICKKLGYQSNEKVQYRLIDEKDLNDMVSHQFDNSSDGVKVGLFEKYSSPTKARIINKFSPIRLNQHVTFLIKPSRPLTQLENWNDDDLKECYRLEIKCY